MADEAYMKEWTEICSAFCKRENAKLLFVNIDNFGAQFTDGSFRHIYAGELAQILSGGEKHGIPQQRDC